MRLHKLRITAFGAIDSVEVEFGAGLNVLYGPNDLGKSTVVAAVRLGLLLPHASSHSERYVAWTGGGDPVVEATFETGVQRIWRVRKQFGKAGSSVLHESRNGRDFDQVEQGRKVDGRLREILGWGIAEPGGAGGAKGVPPSFLATALLSPQDDVGAILQNSLQIDSAASGKEKIAAALQALAQDPLFSALLKETQERRDSAFTDKGAKKTAKGSVFKTASERLRETREEKEKLERIVADSKGAEEELIVLTDRRTQKQGALATAAELADKLGRLAEQAACRSLAAEKIQQAKDELGRIKRIGTETQNAERKAEQLSKNITEAERALNAAKTRHAEADAALKNAEEAARAEAPDSGAADTVLRQQLELRKAAAEKKALDAQQKLAKAEAAKKLVEAASKAKLELQELESKALSAAKAVSQSASKLTAVVEGLSRCDVLERALDLVAAAKRVTEAQATLNQQADLKRRLKTVSSARAKLADQRAAIKVPPSKALGPMRRLAEERAAARGALDVGLVVTVTPKSRFDLRARSDGNEVKLGSKKTQPVDIEARAEIELGIGDVAAVHVRGGRRDAQEKARSLEERWSREVVPHLSDAGVTDIAGLDAKCEEAQKLDSSINEKNAELESLRAQIAGIDGAAEVLREASDHAAACLAALGDTTVESLAGDLKSLGTDAVAGLRKRRAKYSSESESAREVANQAVKDSTLADERVRNSKELSEAAIRARDAAFADFPDGLDTASSAARTALAAADEESKQVNAELATLEATIAARKQRIDAALSGARANATQAATGVDAAQAQLTTAKTEHASEHGRFLQLQRQRDAENLTAAEARLKEVTTSHAALLVPERLVSEQEVIAARKAAAAIGLELSAIEHEILRKHGALEQVGGAVARERLRDANEAFNLAARYEREIEAEYDAWKLLLEQMKEADAAQASNLGQSLGPAIAARFQNLTRQRYQTVQLTADLATQGIVVAGEVRAPEYFSVGTREQLSTLYRLCLAEYLGSTIVLDDQLVQSDANRMDWFRSLLAEKSRKFQILVFTCRPSDYLDKGAMVPDGTAFHVDSDGGFMRAVDLGRAIQRR
jgi:hypothetical protein